VAGSQNLLVTADLPGVTSRIVEQHYGNGVVVPWTSGAAGDQNPIYAVMEDPNSGRIQPMDAMGQILAEEVIRVADNIDRMTSRATVQGGQNVVSVPGKQQNQYSSTADYTFIDADPLDIRLTILRVGPVVFGGVSGEVLTRIGKRFKEESPFRESIMITHCNGAVGYLPDDNAYERPGYEIIVSRVKEGAESAIVNGLLDLIEK
jgi:neutral ceramidase